jgi:hypothetical protein
LTRLINPESHVELQDHQTLEDAGMLSDQALAEGVIQLFAQKLKKVVVADELQIIPDEVTDSKLASLCDRIRDDPPNILVLCGCHRVTNISCLVQLSTISHLDMTGCNIGTHSILSGYDLGTKSGFHLAGAIKDMGALMKLIFGGDGYHIDNEFVTAEPATLEVGMTKADLSNKNLGVGGAIIISAWISHKDYNGTLSHLNLASNNIGQLVPPDGWRGPDNTGYYDGPNGEMTMTCPQGSSPEGAIAVANAISDTRTMTSLNLASNELGIEGVKIIAACLPKCT